MRERREKRRKNGMTMKEIRRYTEIHFARIKFVIYNLYTSGCVNERKKKTTHNTGVMFKTATSLPIFVLVIHTIHLQWHSVRIHHFKYSRTHTPGCAIHTNTHREREQETKTHLCVCACLCVKYRHNTIELAEQFIRTYGKKHDRTSE